ncbi:MAG: S1C family serine protease [Oscillospiraceae bacterium]
MYNPNEQNHHDDPEFDRHDVAESVGEHVEKQMNAREPVKPDEPGHTGYSDAGYILSDEAPTTPRRYYTPPEREDRPPRYETPPKKKNGVLGKVLAGVLAGLLLGSAIGVGVMGMLNTGSDSSAGATPEAVETTAVTPSPTPLLSVNSSSSDNSDEMSATEIYNLATSQAVGIRTEISGYNIFGQETTNAVSGSGFIISEDGYILTNYHVIQDAYEGGYQVNVILYNGGSYPATIVGFEDNDSDIAVLKIDATGLTPVTLGNSSDLEVGETVYAVGNPLGELTYTMTRGMVSALDREITSSDSYTGESNTVNMFQIDAAVNSGNSGGPVYNSCGEVVGVVTAKYSSSGVEGLGFAIPINDAVDIANDLIDQGYVSGKPSMGITVQTLAENVANYYGVPVGSYVYFIEDGSCAQTAGLVVGDIITGLDDYKITGNSDLLAAKKHYSAGDTAKLTVYRDGQYLTLSITFDEQHPSSSTETTTDSAQNVQPYSNSYQGSKATSF